MCHRHGKNISITQKRLTCIGLLEKKRGTDEEHHQSLPRGFCATDPERLRNRKNYITSKYNHKHTDLKQHMEQTELQEASWSM